jgi:membrane protease YdiL (CAAX protease family)
LPAEGSDPETSGKSDWPFRPPDSTDMTGSTDSTDMTGSTDSTDSSSLGRPDGRPGDSMAEHRPVWADSPATSPATSPYGAATRQGGLAVLPGGPPTRRDGLAWVLAAVVGFVAGQVVALVAVDVAASITGNGARLSQIATMAAPPEWYVLSSLVGLWVGFGLAPWLASRLRGTGRLIDDVGLRFRWVDIAGIGIGIGGQIVVGVIYAPFIRHIHDFSAPTQKLTGASHGGGFAVIALFTVLGAPFFEELFFRGLLLRGLVRWFVPNGPSSATTRTVAVVAAIALDGLLFGLAHGELVQLAGLAVFGAILATVSLRTGRQGMNMVAHATFNLVAVLAILNNGGGVVH